MADIVTENVTPQETSDQEDYAPKNTLEKVGLWQERVSLSRKDMEDWADKSGAKRFIDEYNGNFQLFFQGRTKQYPVPPINDIFAYVDADVATTYNRDPYISVNPKAGTVKGAKLWEAIINYYWRELRLKEELEPEIIDKDLVGFGWHKVGYDVESEGAEEDMKILKEGIYSARVDWKDVVYNIGSKRPPKDCLWMAQRIVKPLSFVKKKYPNAAKLQGVPSPEIDRKSYETSQYKDDVSVAVLWEIWDRENREIVLIAEGLNDQFLEDPRPWPEYMDEFPFLMYWDYYAPGKSRPMSAIAPWETQVHEKMVLLGAAVLHAKRWNRQMITKNQTLSDEDLDKLERGDDGAIIKITGSSTGNLREEIMFMDWGSFPPDFMILMDRLSSIQRDVSGQPEFFRGGVTKTTTRTEGELQLIQEGAKGRTDRRIDRFETHIEDIANQMLKHLKWNFDFENTVRITGDTPEEVIEALDDHFDPVTGTVTFTPKDIAGDYEAEIKSGSTLPLNRETKVKIIQNLIGALGNIEQTGVSPMLRTLITELLAEFGGMKALEEAFKEEQAVTQQQMENESQETDADSIKARSQAAKNVAQADKIGAETDQIRLNTGVEEEQGAEEGAGVLA